MTIDLSRRGLLLAASAGLILPASALANVAPKQIRLMATDGRAIDAWHWRARGKRLGTIAFSHGALSAPRKYELLIQPWVTAGYDVVAPLHVDSTDHPRTKDFPGLASWKARIEDMRAVALYIGGHHIAAGHSYGGLTALMMGGADTVVPEGVSTPLRDRQAVAVLAFSPPPAIPALVRPNGYAALAVPALIQTGTRDVMPGGQKSPEAWRAHLDAYEQATPGGNRYALILDEVDHYFGGAICEFDKPGPPRPDQVARAAEISLLFLGAFAGQSKRNRKTLDARLGRSEGLLLTRK